MILSFCLHTKRIFTISYVSNPWTHFCFRFIFYRLNNGCSNDFQFVQFENSRLRRTIHVRPYIGSDDHDLFGSDAFEMRLDSRRMNSNEINKSVTTNMRCSMNLEQIITMSSRKKKSLLNFLLGKNTIKTDWREHVNICEILGVLNSPRGRLLSVILGIRVKL